MEEVFYLQHQGDNDRDHSTKSSFMLCTTSCCLMASPSVAPLTPKLLQTLLPACSITVGSQLISLLFITLQLGRKKDRVYSLGKNEYLGFISFPLKNKEL
jgi:hypothetical protein